MREGGGGFKGGGSSDEGRCAIEGECTTEGGREKYNRCATERTNYFVYCFDMNNIPAFVVCSLIPFFNRIYHRTPNLALFSVLALTLDDFHLS